MAASSSRKGKGKAVPAASPAVAQIPLGKQLAHTDKAVRDAAVRNLRVFLSRGGGGGGDGTGGAGAGAEDQLAEDERVAGESSTYIHLEHGEMAKLWKGLFYCFWMSDKPLIQQALARDLAELVLSINPRLRSSDPGAARAERDAAALGFLAGFWECMCREWEGIDRLRIDKFYMLIRRFVNASLRLLVRAGWAEQRVRVVNEILSGAGDKRPGPLDPANPRIPLSLATHLADIYLTELNVVLSSSAADVSSSTTTTTTPAPPLALLLEPFSALLARSPSPVLFTRLMDTLYRPLFTRMDARIAAATAAAGPVPPVGKKRKLASAPRADEEDKDGYEGLVGSAQAAGLGKNGAETALRLKGEVMRGMFALAAREDAREANRRKVYLVWNEFGGGEDGDDADGDGDW